MKCATITAFNLHHSELWNHLHSVTTSEEMNVKRCIYEDEYSLTITIEVLIKLSVTGHALLLTIEPRPLL